MATVTWTAIPPTAQAWGNPNDLTTEDQISLVSEDGELIDIEPPPTLGAN